MSPTDTAVSVASHNFVLSRNRNLLKNQIQAAVTIHGQANEPAMTAIATNQHFPPGDIQIGVFSVNASIAGDKIPFASSRGTVEFSASASTFAGLGVFRSSAAAIDALELDAHAADRLADGLELQRADNELFLMLRCGYNLQGAAKGSVALGTVGAIKFNVAGGDEAKYAVVRRFADDVGARQAIADTVESWRLPSQIRTAADLDPGTWIVSEVNGSIQAGVGLELGYNFSWIREGKLGNLTGDIGLKIQAGVEAAVRFFASGNYAVVVSRATDANVLRLQLFKLSQHGSELGLNMAARVDTIAGLPEKADDFIAAVFGVHGAQIVKQLHAIEEWTDPNANLPAKLAKLSSKYGRKLLKEVTNIDPLDPATFQAAKDKLKNALDLWNTLDQRAHSVATMLWQLASTNAPALDTIRQTAGIIHQGDLTSIRTWLRDQLQQVAFLRTPVGRWLQSAVPDGLLSAVSTTQAFQQLQEVARITHEVLDPASAGAVVRRLVKYVNENLHIGQIQEAINGASPTVIDEWLQAKLADFLDQSLDIAEIKKIQAAIDHLLSLRNTIYEQARKALNRNYQFQLTSSYRKVTTRTVLADIEFNFNHDVDQAFAKALDGEIGTLFINSPAGVTVRSSELAYGISRQSHVEISLPWMQSRVDHVNDSLAKLAVRGDGARVYLMNAQDVVSERDRRSSALMIGAQVAATGGEVRVHDADSMTYSYSFRQAIFDIRTDQLRRQLRPYAEVYLPNAFTDEKLDAWVNRMAAEIDAAAGEGNGPEVFGKALIALNVSLHGNAMTAWRKASRKRKDPVYKRVSLNIQKALKLLVPFYYFEDLDRYKNLDAAAALLAYAAIPPMNDMRLDLQGNLVEDVGGDWIWDIEDTTLREAIVEQHQPTTDRLMAELARIFPVLRDTGRDSGEFYKPMAINRNRILGSVGDGPGRTLLSGLLRAEFAIIELAVDAGIELAKFDPGQPKDAFEHLAKFGAKITEAFNKKAGDFVFDGAVLRPLSTLIFIAATKAFDAEVHLKTDAMLSVAAIRRTSAFTRGQFLAGEEPSETDILVEDRVSMIHV